MKATKMKPGRLTRNQEKDRIQNELKRMTQDWKTYFSIPNMQRDILLMPFRYYAYLLTMQQMGLVSNILLLNIMMRYGGVMTTLLNVIFTVILVFPTMVMIIFMANYNRKGMIMFWDCIPVFKGIGYSVCLWVCLRQLLDVSYCSLSLLYIPTVFYWELPWRTCNFTYATVDCWPMNKKFPSYFDCRHWNISLSTLEYFKFQIRGHNKNDGFGVPIFGWSICASMTWFIVFVAMCVGFRKFVRPLYKFHMYTTIIFIFLFLSIIVTSGKSTENIVYQQASTFFYGKLWTDLLSQSLEIVVPGVTAYTACFHPIDQTPYVTTIILCIMRIGLGFMLMIWESNVISITMNNYDMKYMSCMKVIGTDVVYGLTTDILTRMYFNRVYLLFWFIYIYVDGLATAIIAYASVYNSLSRQFIFVNKNRISGCALVCFLAAICNLVLITPASISTGSVFLYFVIDVNQAILVAISMVVILSVYHLKTIVTDYEFKYKEKPNDFLIKFWKLSPYFQAFICVQIISSIMGHSGKSSYKYVAIAIDFVILLPIFCIMLYLYCKHLKLQRLNRLVRPAPEWGPLRVADRERRLLFVPHRESGYKKITLDCKHKCLLYSKKYEEERENQDQKKIKLLESIGQEQEVAHGKA